MTEADEIYRVLIVDDDPAIRDILLDACSLDNVNIRTASRMDAAEYEINLGRFDLVIVDVRLRGILENEGLELLNYIKRKWPATKVIIMTAYGPDKLRRDAYECGADYFFQKPFDLEKVRTIIQEITKQ